MGRPRRCVHGGTQDWYNPLAARCSVMPHWFAAQGLEEPLMPAGLILIALKYLLLAALLSFVVIVLREMIAALPVAEEREPAEKQRRERVARRHEGDLMERRVMAPRAAGGGQQGRGIARRPALLASSAAALEVVESGKSRLSAGSRFSIRTGAHIGRAPSNDIVIDDVHVSRYHAYLGRRGQGWVIVDKGSVNGTLVNGTRISGPHALSDGDLITIGGVRLRFLAGGGGGDE